MFQVNRLTWRLLTVSLFFSVDALAVSPAAVPGEFVVKLNGAVHSLSAKTLGEQLGGEIKEVISQDSQAVLLVRPVVENSDFSVRSLSAIPLVAYAEPNYIYEAVKLPNDPELGNLWGLINNGQKVENSEGKKGVDIDMERAWELATGSHEVVVAIIDTGIDYTIADLAPNMWVNQAEKDGEPGVDDDNNGFVDDIYGYDFANNDGDPKDDNAHGSHCAGTIGANGDDGIGVVGVNWKVKMMGVKFLSRSGGGTLANALKSIDYARQMGAHIMSNSWGGGGFSQALQESIERARDAGILFVAAAGNHNANNDLSPTYPANYPVDNVISVAAIANNGDLASFSCYGAETVHLAAPGVSVLSTTPSGYEYFDGTSMATPHVSGVAALLKAHDPSLTYAEIKERMIATSRMIPSLRSKVKGGLVNAYHALTNTPAPTDPDDPFTWEKAPFQLSSPHPYPINFEETWTVSVPGATQIAIFFSRFETESGYDRVTIKDSTGKIVATWSGNRNGQFSPVITGDTATVTLSSDHTVTRYGFDIDGIAFK